MAWIYEEAQTYYAFGYYSDEAKNNAYEMYRWFSGVMTLEAMCGIIGNACYESHGLNPAQKQVSSGAGWGLIQWTPYSNLVDYVNTWYDGDEQCELILREGRGEVSGRFFASKKHPEYSYSWSQFCQLTDIEEAVKAYLWERERPLEKYAQQTLQDRINMARFYYEYLSGEEPPTPPEPPEPPEKVDKAMLFLILSNRKRKR